MIVTLLTDFGTLDHYVGVMKAVILAAAPSVPIVDLGHEIPPGDVAEGAFALLASYRHCPAGTVHVGVVDPGVGSERRVIVVEAAGQRFVGPDNGLFSFVLDREPGARVYEVTDRSHFRDPVSTTFHGRDIFAPLGAALVGGVLPDTLGPPLSEAVRLPSLAPSRLPEGGLRGRILHVDRFGNCVTSISADDLPDVRGLLEGSLAGRTVASLRDTYAGGSGVEPFLVWGSSGLLEVSLNGRSAASHLGVSRDDPIVVRERPRSGDGTR